MIRYVIRRYEDVGDPPTKKVVGFNITNTENNKSKYVESTLDLSDVKNKKDIQILDMAYENIRKDIENIHIPDISSNPIIDTEYFPVDKN